MSEFRPHVCGPQSCGYPQADWTRRDDPDADRPNQDRLYTIKIRGTSSNGDTVATEASLDAVNRQVRRAYGRGAFLQVGHAVLGSGMRDGMILRRVGREQNYSVLENVIVYTSPDA